LTSKRASWIEFIPRLYLPLLLLLCPAFAWRPLRGADDFWVHAAIGRWIWQHGHVPHETLFLWGAKPIPWVYHSWLTQLSFYGLLGAGPEYSRPYPVLLFTVVMIALPFALLWHLWRCYTRPTVLMPLIFGLAIWCSVPRFHPRPELFTALFFTCLLIFLVRWHPDEEQVGASCHKSILRPGEAWRIGGVVAMFVLWASFHGAVAVGLVVLAITIICDLMQEKFSPRSRLLAVVGVLCCGAIFLNPYGLQYWQALKPVGGKMFAVIDEWKPIYKSPYLWELMIGEAVLAMMALVVWLKNPQRRWAHLAWLVFMTFSFIQARRHLWLLALVSLAVMSVNAGALDTQRLWRVWRRLMGGSSKASRIDTGDTVATRELPIPEGMRAIARGGIILCLITWGAVATPSDIWTMGAVSHTLPEPTVQFIKKRRPPGRIFNDYENSSYLQWSFAGHPPLFIDMLNGYPDKLMTDYFDVLAVNARGRKWLEQVGYVALRRHTSKEGLAPLAKYLSNSPQWRREYSGPDGQVWVRRTAANRRR